MPDQLPMTGLLDAVDDDYHQRRAVKLSYFVMCEGAGCDREALIGDDTPHPWLCGRCRQEEGADEAEL